MYKNRYFNINNTMITLSIQRGFPVCLAGVARTVIDHLETERRCIVGGVTLRLDIFKVQG